MLFTKMPIETPACSPAPCRIEALVVGLGDAAVAGRHEAARRGGVAERPEPGQQRRHEHQQPGREQRLRPLGDRAPVAVREVGAQRSAARRCAVDERPRAQDERLEPARDGVVAEAPPRVGEIGRRLAVARAEAQDVGGRQPPRAPARCGDEARELVPGRAALGRERVRVHAEAVAAAAGRGAGP